MSFAQSTKLRADDAREVHRVCPRIPGLALNGRRQPCGIDLATSALPASECDDLGHRPLVTLDWCIGRQLLEERRLRVLALRSGLAFGGTLLLR